MTELQSKTLLPLLVAAWLCGAIAPSTMAEATSGLVLINDDNLVQLIKDEEFVIVLFGKRWIIIIMFASIELIFGFGPNK